MKMKVGDMASQHNAAKPATCGSLVVVANDCVGHSIQRDVESTAGTKSLIPKIYAVAWTFSLQDVHASLFQNLRKLVARDLQHGFFPYARPPTDLWRTHLAALLRVLLPETRRQRGNPLDKDEIERVIESATRLLNGRLGGLMLQHYCYLPGCCGGQKLSVCILDLAALLYDLVVRELGLDLPSTIKWYTLPPHAAKQALGCLVNGVLPRLIRDTFEARDTADQDSFQGWAWTFEQPEFEKLICLSGHLLSTGQWAIQKCVVRLNRASEIKVLQGLVIAHVICLW
jgi:hypothetical protein